VLVELVVVLDVGLALAVLDLVQRGLGDVDVAAFDQFRHLPVEEGQQQGADVGAIDVGIGHDDDAVIAQLGDVEVLGADAAAQRGHQRDDLLAGYKLVEAGLLDVEHLAAQRQDGLELPVAALLGGAAGGVTLDDVHLAQGRVLFLAVRQLARQAEAVQHALAARHVARLARGLAGSGGFDDLAGDDLGIERLFLEVVGQLLRHDFLDGGPGFGRHQLHLGLRGELRIRHLHREHAGQAFAHVIAGDLDLGLLGDLVFFDVFVDHPRHGGAQAGEVGAAVRLRNVVGEAQDLLGVGVVPLHRHFDVDVDAVLHRHSRRMEHGRVQDGLGAVDVLDEALDAAGEGEVFFLHVALVDEADLDAVVEEGKFAQALGQDVVVILDVAENFLVGHEVNFGTAFLGITEDSQGRNLDPVLDFDDAIYRVAAVELHVVFLAVAPDDEAQPFRKGIDAGHTDAVQATGNLVRILVELAAGVQHAHDDLGRRAFRFMLVVELDPGRYAAPVVGHRDRTVGVDGDDNVVTVTGQRLVDGVVDHLEHHVVQAGAVGGIADVHPRTFADRLEAFKLLDAGFVVSRCVRGHELVLGWCIKFASA
jgi:hypothetical protein